MEVLKYNVALTIAGSDPSGGAGIQADLKTFSALGCYGMSVITALTAQNTKGVFGIKEIENNFVSEQIHSILNDTKVDAIKTGMLFSKATIKAVAKILTNHPKIPLIVDPVIVSSSGKKLLKEDAIQSFIQHLLPRATLITPNRLEAETLLKRNIKNFSDMESACHNFIEIGAKAVLIKGGDMKHLESNDCFGFINKNNEIEIQWLNAKRVETNNTHGTGCTLSAAITAFLANDYILALAVKKAKAYITGALQAGANYNLGQGIGPVHHFYKLWEKTL